MQERTGIVTLKGNPMTLLGPQLKAGDRAPDFVVADGALQPVRLADFKGKTKLISVVPSLDTPICEMEIKRFNDEAAALSKDAVIMFISMDLPFAQKRFCRENRLSRIKTFSDHRDADFGLKYGVLIKENRLLARAVFIVDENQTVRYAEYVPDLTQPPDFEAAFSALKKLL